MPEEGWSGRLRDRSPDICSELRLPGPPVRTSPRKKHISKKPRLLEPSDNEHLNSDHNVRDDYLSRIPDDFNFPSSSNRLAPSDGDSLEEFSPTYTDEPEGGMETINPFVQDAFFNHDTSLMDAFGSLNVAEPAFFYSSEPMGEGVEGGGSGSGGGVIGIGNDGLNTPPHRSPSPIITPLMSPESSISAPDTPQMFPPSEIDQISSPVSTSSSSSRSHLVRLRQTSPVLKPKPINRIPNKTIKRVVVNKQSLPTPTKIKTRRSERIMTPIITNIKQSSRDIKKIKKQEDSDDEERSMSPDLKPNTNKSSAQTQGQLDTYIYRRTTPVSVDENHRPIKHDKSNELEKSMKERILDFVESYEKYERPGKLLRLKLTNFMCHDNFNEEWHKQVNYITADNGAGKSAILVALQLVFGAKASTTMRSTSVKDLIQYNKYDSQIEVTLSNDGNLDIDKYGNEISIIRTIPRNGTSRYQIRTPDGKGKRSLPKKELELIKATLQIMVDNPAMILNQEASRNFLRTTDPQALYMYFYRGLNLEHCEVLLIRSKDDIEAARNALSTKYKLLEELQTKAREFKADYDAVLILENGKERALDLNREYHWSIVSQVEEDLSTVQENLDNVVKKCEVLEEHLQHISAQQNSLDTNQESSKNKLKLLKKVLHSKRDEYEQKCREAHAQRQELGAGKAKLINVTKIIKEKTSRVQGVEAEMAKIREDSEAKYKRQVREIEDQKRDLLERKVVARERLNNEKGNKEHSYTKHDKCREMEVEWTAKYEDIQYRIRAKEEELKSIEKKKNLKYNRYGPEMVRLMAEIEKLVAKRKFKDPPTGPQSACYTVKEEFREYAPLIEHILGSTLFQIRVGYIEDKVLLQKLMKDIYGKKQQPDILYHPMKNRKRYNLMHVPRTDDYNTVLDALDIMDNDPVVVNWLADSNGIEKILLFRTEEKACNIMKEARRVPRGCNIGYSLNFKRIHADPHFRSMVINPVKTKTTYIQISSHLGNDELLRNEIEELEKESQEILVELEKSKREVRMAEGLDREVDRRLKTAQKEVNNLETSLQGLDETIAHGPDIVSYMEDLEELRSSIEQNIMEKGNLEELIKEQKPKYEAVESDKKRWEAMVESTEAEIQTVENQGDFAKRANDLRIKFKNINEDLANQNLSKESLDRKVDDITTNLAKCTKLAKTKGTRVEARRDSSAIKEELRCLEQLLHKNRHKISEKNKLKEDWEQAQVIADTIDKDIRVARNLIDTLIPTITSQFRRFDKKKNDFGNTLQASFQSLVSSRNFAGKLIIDHKERNLMFWVSPDTNSEERAKAYKKKFENCMLYKKGMRDYISGLSGGERSFSTICFMVSMWKTMEAPFYILDEFDVFMDQANRKTSQMILNAHTRSQPEAQFIFITPLKLDSIIYPENAKLLRLYPPIRDSRQVAEDEAHKTRLVRNTEDKQKGPATKRTHYDDSGNVRRVDDYFDYSYKPPPPPPTSQAVAIMC